MTISDQSAGGERRVVEPAPFHLRLIEDARTVLGQYGLLLAGGYAMRAHGCVERPVDDLTFATADETPLPDVAAAVAGAFRGKGLSAEVCDSGPRMARVVVTDDITGQACEVGLLRESLGDRPAAPSLPALGLFPALGLDDAVGLAVRDLHNRGLPSDLADVASVAGPYPFRLLERLGASHEDDWRTEELIQRLETADLLADEAFAAYNLDEEGIAAVRRFAYAWVEDIKLRRVEDGDAEFDLDVPEVD